MIISATPFRLEFAGGSTDIEYFYRQYPGHVLNTTLNRYVYVCVSPKFDGKIRVSYAQTENVDHREEIQHTRVKAALEHLGIERGIEIVSIADIPAKGSGLGSSSSFIVGLLNALYYHLGKSISTRDLAELACDLEINKLKEPIGKQDQYAAAFGGLNLMVFNQDGRVDVNPIFLSPKKKKDFEGHILLIYTGISRFTSEILGRQTSSNIDEQIPYLRKMGDLAEQGAKAIEKGDFRQLAQILEEEWTTKKHLTSGISGEEIEEMYHQAKAAGAWGGRVSGAGGGGFLLLVAPPEAHQAIRQTLNKYIFLPVHFSEAGSTLIFNK